MQEKRVLDLLKALTVGNIATAIENYEDELEDYSFPIRQSQMLGKMMDYNTRRQCEPTDCLSEYAFSSAVQTISNSSDLSCNNIRHTFSYT